MPPSHRQRSDVQALRALAVLAVVLYHLWPGAVPGGFVGVDVFFVVSGLLITSLLLREAQQTGRVSLTRFWARRVRRILPAALLVLSVCGVAILTIVPQVDRAPLLAELAASAAFVQNWHLAAEAVDYFAVEAPSPTLHLWTLSVEEQFYLVWPLLLVGALALRRPGLVLAAVTLASLAAGVWLTAVRPELAYLVTPARAWEFGAGGLLAVLGARWTPGPRTGAVLCGTGLAAILVAVLAFDGRTPFPGVAALLPVLGACAVLAGRHEAPVFRARPVRAVGDWSYSAYLWHWPLIVLAPIALGHGLGDAGRVGVLVTTLALAAATKRWVEDPLRRAPVATRGQLGRVLATGLAGVAALAATGLAAKGWLEGLARADAGAALALARDAPPCFGAAARDPDRPCEDPRRRGTVLPAPAAARAQPEPGCEIVERDRRLRVCASGRPLGRERETVALVGDSHAAHWRPALDGVARRQQWRVLSLTRTGCPLSRDLRGLRARAQQTCRTWNAQVLAWLRAHPEVETIIVAAHTRGGRRWKAQRRGALAALRALPPRRLVVLRDTPTMRGWTLSCVEGAVAGGQDPAAACAVPLARALDPDPTAAAALDLGDRARVIDLTRFFCEADRCLPVVGGALVHRDEDHMTPVFATTLAPYLGRALRRAGA